MQIFYSNSIQDNIVTLSQEESEHCVRVLRLGSGELVHVIDGKGGLFEALIEKADPRGCLLKITRVLPVIPNRNFNVHIAISPTKHIDRFEWFIEKAVEIGIDTITPLLCKRSERRIIKTGRLGKLVISTMKQAIITHLPVLNELTDFADFVKHLKGYEHNRHIAHCHNTEKKLLKAAILPDRDVIVLIGPEGDFSPDEIETAGKNGFQAVSLGKNRLRTETAGIVACNTINILNNLG